VAPQALGGIQVVAEAISRGAQVPTRRWSILGVQAGDGETRVTARPWQVRVGKRQRRMGKTTTRRLLALALGAIVTAGGSATLEAGGDCPPGWNVAVRKQDSAGRTFTWRAGAT
jgi:hypothetical protein